MSLIIAGRFDTFAQAEAAAGQLFARGFAEDDVTLFFVNPPGQHGRFPLGGDVAVDAGTRKAGAGAGRGIVFGAIAGAVIGAVALALMQASVLVLALATGLGAYLGSLVGALSMTRDPDRVSNAPRSRSPGQDRARCRRAAGRARQSRHARDGRRGIAPGGRQGRRTCLRALERRPLGRFRPAGAAGAGQPSVTWAMPMRADAAR
ncbi:hypothetical protein OJJOAM_003508 [Cupriavidus sp. H18C1]